jgi:hypothetical protein
MHSIHSVLGRRTSVPRCVLRLAGRAVNNPKTRYPQLPPLLARGLSTNPKKDEKRDAIHFRVSVTPHPLGDKAKVDPNKDLGDHIGRQQNHIWLEEELNEKLSKLYHHK